MRYSALFLLALGCADPLAPEFHQPASLTDTFSPAPAPPIVKRTGPEEGFVDCDEWVLVEITINVVTYYEYLNPCN